jgi:hypothetical protein
MVEVGTLAQEHRALVLLYGQVQTRCSAQLRQQAGQIERLQAEVMRLRAAVIVHRTALAYAREERHAAGPQASRRLQMLVDRLQALLRERSIARA